MSNNNLKKNKIMGKRIKKVVKEKRVNATKVTENETNEQQLQSKGNGKNLVSCLMLTYDRALQKPIPSIIFFENAVRNFTEQTYKKKELIIVNSGSKSYYEQCCEILEKFKDFKILHFFVTRDEYPTMGDLRNKAVEEASGDFIMTWDDDDKRSNSLIEIEMNAMLQENADVVMIQQIEVQMQLGRVPFPTNYYKGFEPSMLARKTDKVKYSIVSHSDTKYIEDLKANGYKEIVIADNANSDYTYCYWGTNITEKDRFTAIILTSQKRGGK